MQTRTIAAALAAASLLFLAACGGGGGDGGSLSEQSLTRSGAQTIASGHALGAAQRAATATPRFGSVIQSTGAADRARASLTAGPRLQVSIDRGSGGAIALDTAAHAVDAGLGTSAVTGRARRGRLPAQIRRELAYPGAGRRRVGPGIRRLARRRLLAPCHGEYRGRNDHVSRSGSLRGRDGDPGHPEPAGGRNRQLSRHRGGLLCVAIRDGRGLWHPPWNPRGRRV